jgi:phospholipase/lecithinase/hemolysin
MNDQVRRHGCRVLPLRFASSFWRLAPFLVMSLLPALCARAALLTGIGVFGDSLSDEYQFATDPIDRQAARNYVEQLAAYRGLNFGAFSTVSRGEPRLQGYAYDFARSGATTADLGPQVAGLAPLVSSGEVTLGFLTVGSNDFRNLINGGDPFAAASAGITNTVAAANALLAQNPSFKLAIANVPDLTRTPGAALAVAQDPSLAAKLPQLSALIDFYNNTLAGQFASNPRVALVDINGLYNDVLSPSFRIDGLALDTTTPSTDPTHLFIDPIHPGTLGQGGIANGFIQTIDQQFGAGVQPFSNPELLNAAGLPLPRAAWTGLFTFLIAIAAIKRRRALERTTNAC